MTVYCDYCGHKAALVDDSEIYGRSFGHTAYLCRNCGAYVGCHGRTDKPLGRLADAALRKWKMAAHASFDPLWKTGPFRGRRKAAYGWLAEQMGLPIEKTHIGMFDIPQCQEVIKIIEKGDFKMLNFNKKDAHVYPFDESPGAGIIMDVDLEQMIRESERLRVCKAIFNSSSIENWHLRDALEAVLAEPSVAPVSNDVPGSCIPAQEVDHA